MTCFCSHIQSWEGWKLNKPNHLFFVSFGFLVLLFLAPDVQSPAIKGVLFFLSSHVLDSSLAAVENEPFELSLLTFNLGGRHEGADGTVCRVRGEVKTFQCQSLVMGSH